MEINNKIAIVTGGLGGIGFAIIQHLLRNGAEYIGIFDVIESDNTVVIERLKQLQGEFKQGTFGYYRCNVEDKKEFLTCYEKVVNLKKYVDILVNNAGIINEKCISQIIDVNFKAVMNGTMIAIEHMGKHKGYKGGIILNIGSIAGIHGIPIIPIYSATKAAIIVFTMLMKEYNEQFGIRCLCICPGITKTNICQIDHVRRCTYDFVETMAIRNQLESYQQKSDSVASAVVQVIKEGKHDPIWVAQNDEPVFVLEREENLENLRISF